MTHSMGPEESLHRDCVSVLRVYEARGLLSYCHCPNGGYRTKAEAGVFSALGVRAGVPDLLVFLPGGRSVQIELKAGRNGLTAAQKAWHATMKLLGHRISVCRSVDELMLILSGAGVPVIARVMA